MLFIMRFKDLLQLNAIAQHRGEIGRTLRAHRDVIPRGLAADERDDFRDELVRVYSLAFGRAFLEQGAHPVDDLGSSRRIPSS